MSASYSSTSSTTHHLPQNGDPSLTAAHSHLSPSYHGSHSYTNNHNLNTTLSPSSTNYGKFNEEWDASQRGSSLLDGHHHSSNHHHDDTMQRSNSVASHHSHSGVSQGETLTPSRGGTLKKKASLRRGGSIKRSASKRSSRAGSVRSLALQSYNGEDDDTRSAFYCPVPTHGNPTEVLANRFNAWRKVLKDLIAYFREVQTQYDHRAKSLLKLSNVLNNIQTPPVFLTSGGVEDALEILRDYHRKAILEANKAKDIEADVILALTGLRSDLQQKIKEIKSLSGDFKNSVDKEMDATAKAVNTLQESLGRSDVDPSATTGRQDPYLLRLAVDRQVERQIDEESYLHQAYLNLEASGRELEAIVVGEIQKSYNALAGILKRDADESLSAVEELRTGPIAMPKDHEWAAFIDKDENFVDPRIPIRTPESIHYPGRDSELAAEVRAGLLERKSKYLKSYTPGWYVLSPTHLHEFKSADKSQAPVMSLYLPEQKLGSHSAEGASSNKFMLKGRQTGAMHRGHSWVFRAESYDTMMAWYEDIKSLTEKTPQERNAYVRQHARSFSGSSQRAASISSDGVVDEDDEEPFSANASAIVAPEQKQDRRPQAGGRFPSDIQVNAQRGLQAPLSSSSGSSHHGDIQDRDIVAAASALPGSGTEYYNHEQPLQQNDYENAYQQNAYQQDTYQQTAQPVVAGYAGDQTAQRQAQPYTPEEVNNYTHQPPATETYVNNNTNQTFVGGAYVPFPTGQDEAEAGQQQTVREVPAAEEPTQQSDSHYETTDVPVPISTNIYSRDDQSTHSPYAAGGRSVGDSIDTAGLEGLTVNDAKPTNTSTEVDGISSDAKLRPSMGTQQQSRGTLSHLHVPGEYPRGTPVVEKPNAGLPV